MDDPGGALALFRHLPGRPLWRDEPGAAALAGGRWPGWAGLVKA
ncbi:hypothetical protein [Oryzihumus sp.]